MTVEPELEAEMRQQIDNIVEVLAHTWNDLDQQGKDHARTVSVNLLRVYGLDAEHPAVMEAFAIGLWLGTETDKVSVQQVQLTMGLWAVARGWT